MGNLILIFLSGFYGFGLLLVAIIIGVCGLIENKLIRVMLFWVIFVIGVILFIQAFIFGQLTSNIASNIQGGPSLPEVYSSLEGLSSLADMNNYCDSITVSSQSDICLARAVSLLLSERNDKTTKTISFIQTCQKIKNSKSEQKRNCFTGIRAYRLNEINNNTELSTLINNEIGANSNQ